LPSRAQGFTKHRLGGVTYWRKAGDGPRLPDVHLRDDSVASFDAEGAKRAKHGVDRRPIVFIHGVGFGIVSASVGSDAALQ
jgi:hypothetical protein